MEVRSVEAIISALNSAKVRYLIVGGLAVNAHGYERLTRDVAFVISLVPENIIRGLHALVAIGYRMSIPITPEQFADPKLRESYRAEKGMVVLRMWSDLHGRTPIDVFVYEPFVFDREYGMAKWEPILGEISAPIVRYETLLEMKRLAARPQDVADIAELERLQELKENSGQ